jgi:hypothetical protein
MFTFILSPAVIGSDASDWTITRKVVAVLQIAMLDIAVVALALY